MSNARIAVLLPAYNEAGAIEKVVSDFRSALPDAEIYVYDNNSSDDTADRARAAGAIVRSEPQQGKGHVMRRMFADIDADVFVLSDADDTYDASIAPVLVQRLLEERLDLLTGVRSQDKDKAFRPGHKFGNRLLTGLVKLIFGDRTEDMLSGYRIMSRRFVKSFPALSRGFEIETELTVHALELQLPMADHPTDYKDRAEGTESKLSTFRDGFRIAFRILTFVKDERPLPLFGGVAAALTALALILAGPRVIQFFETGEFPFVGTAVLATGLVMVGIISLATGLILSTVTQGRREMKRLAYLRFDAPGDSS